MPVKSVLLTLTAVLGAVVTASPARGAEALGVSLPSAAISATFTGGGPPDFADTFVTPYAATEAGVVTRWRTQFLGGTFPPDGPFAGGPGVPTGVQLKILRAIAPTVLQVVAAGAVHDPRPTLQARLAGYPFFLTQDSMIEFVEPGLDVQAGDVIGMTITSDPAIARYVEPLLGVGATRLVQRNVPLGGTVDLADVFTGSLASPPAVQVEVEASVLAVGIDVKPGSFPNSINLGSNGAVPVAILSSPSFAATSVDPLSVSLASAPVALRGRGTPMASQADVNGDGLPDLVVHVSTQALALGPDDTEVVLEGKTVAGASIRGTDSIRVVP